MDKKVMPAQKGPIMAPKLPEVEKPEATGAAAGRGSVASVARKKISKAISLVKYAMKFDNSPRDDKSLMSSRYGMPVQMDNTYRMEPHEVSKFNVQRSVNVIRETLEEHLIAYEYSVTTAPHIIKTLCTVIKDKVKKLGFRRYKIIVNVFLSSLDNQGLEATSRCLWDEKNDTYACATYRGATFVALGTVHGVYTE